MDTFYGFKLGQLQDYDQAGRRVPVTLVRVNPAVVIGWKTADKNNYDAMQVAFGHKKNPSKSIQGYFKTLSEKLTPRYIREVKTDITEEKKPVGEKLQISDVFAVGDKVKVTGISKGKGFQGVVRRHGFKGGPKTHGQSDRQRHPGSIGQTTTPGRVYKGKRMAGHMGHAKATVTNLSVFAVKPEENLILITGLVPGSKNSLLKITKG